MRTSKLAAFVQLVRELGVLRDAQQIYEPALSALHAITGVDRSSILLLDEEGVARFVAWRGISESYRVAVEGHFPWAVDAPSPQAILVEDVRGDPTLASALPALEREHIRAAAFIPLLYNDRLVGKFMIYHASPHVFDEEEIALTNAVAYLVAFAIERTRLNAAVEESNRRKDTFLATLGHELRNPLAAASAALSVMAECPDDPKAQGKARGAIVRSIDQMVQLVDDLLDVSRITHGVIAIEKQPVDLTSIVHHALAPVQRLIAAQRHELVLALAPLWVQADAVRLEQIITNLVHNAAKYTPAGGHIRVATRARDGGIEIAVQDDGLGIEPEEIPRLFELFEQVDQSLARTKGGLGVGLTIVRELVRLHGGVVRATSSGIGRGSTFTVWLPGRIAAPGMTAPPPSVPEPRSARRVLVVDDNQEVATALSLLLQARGHEVAVVADGPSAIAAVTRRTPELVLLDIGLPGMSGYEVASHLRASGYANLRIVAVSGYGQPEDVARSRHAGCDAHVTKPIDVAEIDRLLADV